jgi:hypothetical protein
LTLWVKQQFLSIKKQDRALQAAPWWRPLLLQGILTAKRHGGD